MDSFSFNQIRVRIVDILPRLQYVLDYALFVSQGVSPDLLRNEDQKSGCVKNMGFSCQFLSPSNYFWETITRKSWKDLDRYRCHFSSYY